MTQPIAVQEALPLEMFACPNAECDRFNCFGAGNLSVVERMGKEQAIRRLYCNHCGHRFSERQGSLMQYAKLPEAAVIRILKCLSHGVSLEATADICDVDVRTVQRILLRGGQRAEDFHRLQMDRLQQQPPAVELDELQAKVTRPKKGKKGEAADAVPARRSGVARQAVIGFTWPWPASRGS